MKKVIDLILKQYENSPLVIALLQAIVDGPIDRLSISSQEMKSLFDIDKMTGVNLDNIGTIVGQKRPASFDDETLYSEGIFQLGDSTDPQPEYNSENGFDVGRFIDSSLQNGIDDFGYRLVLKSKVSALYRFSTVPDIEQFCFKMLNKVAHVREYAGYIWITFPFYINLIMREVIKKNCGQALGIRTVLIVNETDRPPFAFDGRSGSLGFGDIDTPDTGGSLVSII